MSILKKAFGISAAACVCMGMSACSTGSGNSDSDIVGDDWRVTGVVSDSGTITRNGEDTKVLVCVHAADASFYYDTEEQVLFGSVNYPITLDGDPWEKFQSIDFADLNGDGNSDVTMKFDDSGSELLMVWFWDTANEQFMYQPEESYIGYDEGRGDLITDDEGQGDPIPDDDGRGDLIPDDGDMVYVLMSDALPFGNMKTLKSEKREDGTYYYADVTEDGKIRVVNTVLPRNLSYDDWNLEEYLTDCALSLGEANTDLLQTVEQNDAYTANMTYPVYVVTYTTGENDDTREWTVFAMDTDLYTYLYGICATPDAADDVRSVYQDIFAGLNMYDGE